MNYTSDEIMVVCIARQVRDGEIVAQGLATPIVAAGYLLARQTHAPNLYFSSAIGQGICRQPAPLRLLQVESLWLDRAIRNLGFVRSVADVLPSLRPMEFFRPAQVDPQGNFKITPYARAIIDPIKDFVRALGRRDGQLSLPPTLLMKTILYLVER